MSWVLIPLSGDASSKVVAAAETMVPHRLCPLPQDGSPPQGPPSVPPPHAYCVLFSMPKQSEMLSGGGRSSLLVQPETVALLGFHGICSRAELRDLSPREIFHSQKLPSGRPWAAWNVY